MNWIFIIFVFGLNPVASQVQNDDKNGSISNGGNPGGLKSSEIAIVIRDQKNNYHFVQAEKLKKTILEESNDTVEVVLLSELNIYGGWTILPIIERLVKRFRESKKWIFFCEDITHVRIKKLIDTFSTYDSNQFLFLGHGLHDREPAIIHHFAFADNPEGFQFPDFAAGWALTIPLLSDIHKRLTTTSPPPDFSIDIQHEIAMFVFNSGKGHRLRDVPEFCVNPLDASKCASVVFYKEPNCGLVDIDDIFIGVKTCSKYHKDRIPIIKKTIMKETKNIILFSDTTDPKIPTEATGIPNTEKGHCAKLFKILDITQARIEWRQKPWIVIIDDDTIMSLSRLRKLLACYDSNEPILLGERYGYGVNYHSYGYDYITGGGGMIFSQTGVQRLLSSHCDCPANDTPDDMWLGNCFRRMNIPVVHNTAFHQARPMEYAADLLAHEYLVSFHKHYNLDPINVYKEYLTNSSSNKNLRDEL